MVGTSWCTRLATISDVSTVYIPGMNANSDDLDQAAFSAAFFGDTGAFAHFRRASNHVAAEVSQGLRARADTLVSKAYGKLCAGQHEQALQAVARAAALDFDEHEQCHPGYWAAHMMLFCAVTDALEEAASDDRSWLPRSLEVLDARGTGTPSGGARAMCDVLSIVAQEYDISAAEGKLIRSRIGTGWDGEALEADAGRDAVTRAQIVVEMLRAVVAFNEPRTAQGGSGASVEAR